MTSNVLRASSFGAAAADYDAYRPSYPDAVVDWMLGETTFSFAPRTVLDLGAGTGKLTDSLVARGLDVIAIEPDAGMLAVLQARHPDVRSMQGSAERIDLPTG
ncbi:MAG TPA: class I SAM-dependent methyltransferase, partial [Propionibacteriaceae bacterium]|nr:class I SAM-dependent methyltransferase [Propionibacteriaceae bacterium]